MTIKHLHWTQLEINQFSKGLHPQMLEPDGYYHVAYIKVTKNARSKTYRIHYDKEYVIAYFENKVLKALKPKCYDDLLELVNTALNQYATRINKQKELF